LALGTKIEGGLLADITGRVGYASGPALFYVKGGWAFFDGSVGTSGINSLAMMVGTTDLRDVSVSGLSGWTLGGGIEYLLNPSWSLKGEYQHFDFGSFDFHPVISDTTVVISNNLTTDVVKVGLNYHIGAMK
jgi:outer membrane immunogenic protein